jgi:hypothetical protein
MTETAQNIPGEVPTDIRAKKNNGTCELCCRISCRFSKHHLKPRKLKKKKEIVKRAVLCPDCTKMVHALHNLEELAGTYNTIEKLKESSKLASYLRWVSNRPIGIVKHPKRSWLGGKYE